MFSAHRLMMVNICIKFHKNVLNGNRVKVWTRTVNGRSGGRTEGTT